MHDVNWRLIAFVAVVAALLNAGFYYRLGELLPSSYFMAAAVLLTVVTHIGVRRRAF